MFLKTDLQCRLSFPFIYTFSGFLGVCVSCNTLVRPDAFFDKGIYFIVSPNPDREAQQTSIEGVQSCFVLFCTNYNCANCFVL